MTFMFAGVIIIFLYLLYLWVVLEYAPLNTLGHTRLWYTFFLSAAGIFIFYKLNIKWILLFCILMSILFLLFNIIYPDNFDKTLMPALQSIWFVPHVVVYILAYSILTSSALIAIKGLYMIYKNKFEIQILHIADRTVITGFAFLTLGLLFGALWAKEAWGQFWSWDPKEVWALSTWLIYLLYSHLRFYYRDRIVLPLWILLISFIILIICWFGINYLPSSQTSLHSYIKK
jgi:ABC-type transport system involved in cytochrome c biogenesis permease subunit